MHAQIPFNYTGLGQLAVVTPNGSAQAQVYVAPLGPQIFTSADGSRLAYAARIRMVRS